MHSNGERVRLIKRTENNDGACNKILTTIWYILHTNADVIDRAAGNAVNTEYNNFHLDFFITRHAGIMELSETYLRVLIKLRSGCPTDEHGTDVL